MNKISEPTSKDWAGVSEAFDLLKEYVAEKDLSKANEAQTRYDVIDRMIKDVLGWEHGQVEVEEHIDGRKKGYVDYILRVGDATIIIEAKRVGASFPTVTKKTRLKINGSVLSTGEIAKAIKQAEEYALEKDADVVCVTNGLSWCFYSLRNKVFNSYATLLFPFSNAGQAEELYSYLSEPQIHDGGLSDIHNVELKPEDRLIDVLNDADGRLNRNNIAEFIAPALNDALYADALLSNAEALEKCFVSTEGRTKFDSLLGMHLADSKPQLVKPAPRIKKSKANGPLENILRHNTSDHAPPVTLVLGPVGAGKSTYLKHFEMVSGRDLLQKSGAYWVYIDFEEMGQAGDPKKFLYDKLNDYILTLNPKDSTVYQSLAKPAYKDVIEGLANGPLAMIASDNKEFNKRIADIMQRDYETVFPYVDRIFKYMVSQKLCVVVLDNVDLYDDEELETRVFAEGLAISKRLLCNVIVSIRDRTYVKHKNSAAFNAYEINRFWLDPPPFRSVLAKRLAYSQKILDGVPAKIPMENGMKLDVPDLSAFFEIVQRSVLNGRAGDFIEGMSDLNIRHGITLIKNFLTSGHIQADKALKTYLTENKTSYSFPFHEIFKGSVLGQWKHYREKRADCINIFDARTNSKRTRLLRLALLTFLAEEAQKESSIEVDVTDCITTMSGCGADEGDVIDALNFLYDNRLIRTVSADSVSTLEKVVITRAGGYYLRVLSHQFVYVESCMTDTAIEDPKVWEKLTTFTRQIENEHSVAERMRLRQERIKIFISYLQELESSMLRHSAKAQSLKVLDKISKDVLHDVGRAVEQASKYHR